MYIYIYIYVCRYVGVCVLCLYVCAKWKHLSNLQYRNNYWLAGDSNIDIAILIWLIFLF